MTENFLMDFKAILERNGVETAGCDASYLTAPAVPFFLEEQFLSENCKRAEIPADLTAETIALAAEIRKDSLLRGLAWHLYRLFCVLPNFKAFPDHIDLTGERTGILYLIIMLSVYPHLKQRMELEGLPQKLADDAMVRCTSLLPNRSVLYPGEKGLQGRALPFMLNYKNSPCFRIGRFDYVLTKALSTYPELFRERATGKYVAMCRSGWKVASDGFLLPANDESVPATEFTISGSCAAGLEIDLDKGVVTGKTITVDLNAYERMLPPEANVLLIHIPGGGGMTLEKCKESFLAGREFCKKYYPEQHFAVFGCISWVFNPAWREYIPDSNMSKLQKSTLAFPFPAAPKSGLYFVFAREDDDRASYPADNSMRRAMLKAWEKGELRSAGMLLPLDEIDNFPSNMKK